MISGRFGNIGELFFEIALKHRRLVVDRSQEVLTLG